MSCENISMYCQSVSQPAQSVSQLAIQAQLVKSFGQLSQAVIKNF